MALEPEAAALSCRYMENESQMDSEDVSDGNSKYVVLHAGGGIADIVSHEVQRNGVLKELTSPVGGGWGELQVDRAFYRLLKTLFGERLIQEFKQNNSHDFLKLMKQFEDVKLDLSGEYNDKVEVNIPYELLNHTEASTIEQSISQNGFTGQIDFTEGNLVLHATQINLLFSESLDHIKNAMRNMLSKDSVKNAKTIYLVGDFAKSVLLQNAIISEFTDKEIIIPEIPSLATLKGAVIFGHMPNVIKSRIIKYTYGLHTQPQLEDPVNQGTFYKLVEIGESITVGTKRTKIYSNFDRSLNVSIYTSTNKSPEYVSDSGCMLLGALNHGELSRDAIGIAVSTIFGDTEIKVQVEEVKRKVKATFDFL